MKEMQSYIHLASRRELIEHPTFRSLVSYSVQTNRDNCAFRGILRFEDNILAPRQNVAIEADANCTCLILPLVGGVEFLNFEHKPIVASGELCLAVPSQNESLIIQNPFENEHINFLKIMLSPNFCFLSNAFSTKSFDLNDSPNGLILLEQCLDNQIFIGGFESRAEAEVDCEENFNSFVFVISGSFEVNGMLLHERDGASCFNIKKLDFESLSIESLILIIKEKS